MNTGVELASLLAQTSSGVSLARASDTGSGIGSESGTGNIIDCLHYFFFRSATYTSYYSYMQLNYYYFSCLYGSCATCIPNLLVVFQLIFRFCYLVARARSHVRAPLKFTFTSYIHYVKDALSHEAARGHTTSVDGEIITLQTMEPEFSSVL